MNFTFISIRFYLLLIIVLGSSLFSTHSAVAQTAQAITPGWEALVTDNGRSLLTVEEAATMNPDPYDEKYKFMKEQALYINSRMKGLRLNTLAAGESLVGNWTCTGYIYSKSRVLGVDQRFPAVSNLELNLSNKLPGELEASMPNIGRYFQFKPVKTVKSYIDDKGTSVWLAEEPNGETGREMCFWSMVNEVTAKGSEIKSIYFERACPVVPDFSDLKSVAPHASVVLKYLSKVSPDDAKKDDVKQQEVIKQIDLPEVSAFEFWSCSR